jgi:hypothetical protein
MEQMMELLKAMQEMMETQVRPKLEGINEIRNQGLKEQICLRKERTSGRIFGKTIELEIMN